MVTPAELKAELASVRWRDRPRLTLWRLDASSFYALWGIFQVAVWAFAFSAILGVVTADKGSFGGTSRVTNGLLVLPLLLVALATSRLTWFFLARPVVDEETYNESRHRRRGR